MTTLGEAIAALEPEGTGWRGTVPENWLQGRTAYGGFSAALALHAAKASDTDLPPLRSAQVAFVGPLAGAITVTARRLRRGRTAAFVQADVASEAGLGLRATFVFMSDRDSAIDHRAGTAPDVAALAAGDSVQRSNALPFIENFEFIDRRAMQVGPAEWLRWVRLKHRDDIDREVEVMAIADCLPPAAMRLHRQLVPVSSMTWQLNMLAAPATRDGWWLLRAASDHAHGGASSQDMAVWNADGTQIAAQMQSVAIFA